MNPRQPKHNDLPSRILRFFVTRQPVSLDPWHHAMLAELSLVEGFWARFEWALGGIYVLAAARLRRSAQDNGWRLDILLIAAYHFLFSCVLIGLLTWQLPEITESWKYVVPTLIMAYMLAAIPAVLGVGLFLGDDAARIGTVLFSVAHALLACAYLTRVHVWAFPALRIGLDVVMIAILLRPQVRRAFQTSPISLHLRNQQGAEI